MHFKILKGSKMERVGLVEGAELDGVSHEEREHACIEGRGVKKITCVFTVGASCASVLLAVYPQYFSVPLIRAVSAVAAAMLAMTAGRTCYQQVFPTDEKEIFALKREIIKLKHEKHRILQNLKTDSQEELRVTEPKNAQIQALLEHSKQRAQDLSSLRTENAQLREQLELYLKEEEQLTVLIETSAASTEAEGAQK
jgi:hypothetical protein